MNIRLQAIAISALLFAGVSPAQIAPSIDAPVQLSEYAFMERMEFKVGYSGNFVWNNALTLGAEYLLSETAKIKSGKRGPKPILNEWLLDGNLGFTTNFSSRTDTGVFANAGILWRRTNKRGKQLSIALNPLGYYRSFLPETYEVQGDDVKRVFLPGRSYYAPALSIGIGRFRKHKTISGRYLHLNLRLRTPYNSGTLPAISIQYGLRFNFSKKR